MRPIFLQKQIHIKSGTSIWQNTIFLFYITIPFYFSLSTPSLLVNNFLLLVGLNDTFRNVKLNSSLNFPCLSMSNNSGSLRCSTMK